MRIKMRKQGWKRLDRRLPQASVPSGPELVVVVVKIRPARLADILQTLLLNKRLQVLVVWREIITQRTKQHA